LHSPHLTYLVNGSALFQMASRLIPVRSLKNTIQPPICSLPSPSISPRLTDLCSITVIHRLSSLEWFDVLRRHIFILDEQRSNSGRKAELFSSGPHHVLSDHSSGTVQSFELLASRTKQKEDQKPQTSLFEGDCYVSHGKARLLYVQGIATK
jgi:hypothetical protein